ncbi:hypothetical protein NDU88_011223 [Pleurodeles waltl]|uniref:Uncharacterized protein n=1 Tax=Pleurodeles waltl TaxID=8319 RepID=A0AAV7QWL9_PLEWA|nr:hypothetical protein NDU88_011223 [Pleurodeles waltl]
MIRGMITEAEAAGWITQQEAEFLDTKNPKVPYFYYLCPLLSTDQDILYLGALGAITSKRDAPPTLRDRLLFYKYLGNTCEFSRVIPFTTKSLLRLWVC